MRLPASMQAAIYRTNLAALAVALFIAATTGCGSSAPMTVVPNPSTPTGLPTPAAAGQVNTYTGAQSPGEWTLTLDNTKNASSYQAITYPPVPNQPTAGTIQPEAGFSSLGAAGLAYEVLGRTAVLRPGDDTTSPVVAVPQTQCYPITGKMRFQYIALYPGPQTGALSQNSPDPLGYGSIVASTDSAGKTWQFEDLQGNVVSGPASFVGNCAVANGQAAIALSGTTMLSDYWATSSGTVSDGPATVTSLPPTTTSTIWVGPSGFFVADQSDPTQVPFAGTSVAGIAEPAAPLSTSALAAATYLGILYQAPSAATTGYPAVEAFTSPVGFGQVVPASGTTMTGGIFPNDAVTGSPNSDTTVNLGKEDATYNGLYPAVAITVLDPAQNCANFPGSLAGFSPPGVSSGINDQGYVTCTFPGIAVAGNPDGKYAIFVSSYNWAANLGGVPLEIFLFQQ